MHGTRARWPSVPGRLQAAWRGLAMNFRDPDSGLRAITMPRSMPSGDPETGAVAKVPASVKPPGNAHGFYSTVCSQSPSPSGPATRKPRSEGVNEPGVPEPAARSRPIQAQSAAVARATASICNAEWARYGGTSGHGGFVHTFSVHGQTNMPAGREGLRHGTPPRQNSTTSPGLMAITFTGLSPSAWISAAGVPGRPGLVP
jgi:hypothetical protein